MNFKLEQADLKGIGLTPNFCTYTFLAYLTERERKRVEEREDWTVQG